jgi:hypothetical protein
MRELFIDAYGLFDTATDRRIEQTRAAMREVVEDEGFWIDLKQLVDQKAKIQALIVQLKTTRRK